MSAQPPSSLSGCRLGTSKSGVMTAYLAKASTAEALKLSETLLIFHDCVAGQFVRFAV